MMIEMEQHRHGGDVYSLAQPIQLDYSANLNPLGMPAEIKQTLCDHVDDYLRYPDSQCRALRAALSGWEQVPPEWVLCGNGAADLLLRICQAVQPKRTLLLAPSFSEYEKAARLVGSEIVYHDLSRQQNFMPDDRILTQLNETVDLFFLCNPNNPTGQVADGALLEKIVARCDKYHILLVVDECFLDFTDGVSCKQWLADHPQLIVVKAFTKLFAIAGLRLGYLLTANETLRANIAAWGQSWVVSAPAQYAGIAACQLGDFAAQSKVLVMEERHWLTAQLQALGLVVIPGQGNYICFRAPFSLWEPLLQKGILVRSCANYRGLDARDHRVCVKLRVDNIRLIQALQEVLDNGKSNHASGYHV